MQMIAKFERIVLKENLVQMVFKVEPNDINDGILELAQSAGAKVDVDVDGAFTELFEVAKLTLQGYCNGRRMQAACRRKAGARHNQSGGG